jgi:hypothetical protein
MEGFMKRVLAAAALAAPLALVPGVASATGTTGTTNSVSIYQYADFGLAGSNLDVDLQVACKGETGTVNLTVDQYYPETPDPLGAHGFGAQDVVCDGKSRLVSATIVGDIFDGGKAKATATLLPSGATTTRWITITAH